MRKIYEIFHNPCHPCPKATDRMIRQKYVWLFVHRDIMIWAKTCIDCQQSKFSRRNQFILEHFNIVPESRFDDIHIDLIGPLPACDGFTYAVWMINRHSRWIEATPMKDMEALTLLRVCYNTWVTRFGSPKTISSDRGSQFETVLFSHLLNLLGCKRKRTTSYHPESNSMIESLHRPLRDALICHKNYNWVRVLPTVLMGNVH